jgi:hypothetical protein
MSRTLFAYGLLGFGFVSATLARADEFSWELSGAVSRVEREQLADTDRSSLSAAYNFDPVDDTSGPYALASFFDPATRVAVTASHQETASGGYSYSSFASVALPELVTESDDYTVSGRYLLPESRWYFGGIYGTADIDGPAVFQEIVIDADHYGLVAGKYFGTATLLELSVDSAESRSEADSIFCIVGQICVVGGRSTTETTTESASIDVLHVRRFRSLTYSLSGRVFETSTDLEIHRPEFTIPFPFTGPVPILPGPLPSITVPARATKVSVPSMRTYSVAGELFPTAKLGVRIGYSRFDGDVAPDEAYDVATTWFFRRNVGLVFAYSRQSAGDDAEFRYTDTAVIRAIGRF